MHCFSTNFHQNEYSFYKKIKLIKADINNIEVDTLRVKFPYPETKLDSFSLLSEDDVHKIIIDSSNA